MSLFNVDTLIFAPINHSRAILPENCFPSAVFAAGDTAYIFCYSMVLKAINPFGEMGAYSLLRTAHVLIEHRPQQSR